MQMCWYNNVNKRFEIVLFSETFKDTELVMLVKVWDIYVSYVT